MRNGGGIEWPAEFLSRSGAQHRHAFAVARFQLRITIDEHAVEVGYARLRKHLKREVAQMAVVALEKNQFHRDGFRKSVE